jgi:hypothetical protein
MRQASQVSGRTRWKTLHVRADQRRGAGAGYAHCVAVRLVRAMAERYARELCGRTGRESRRLVEAAMEWLLLVDPARVVDGAVSGEWLEVQMRMEMRRFGGPGPTPDCLLRIGEPAQLPSPLRSPARRILAPIFPDCSGAPSAPRPGMTSAAQWLRAATIVVEVP